MARSTIRRGSKNADVLHWQTVYLNVPVKDRDGNFGPNTETLTKAWQKARGLKNDGIVGPATWAMAEKSPGPNMTAYGPPTAAQHAATQNQTSAAARAAAAGIKMPPAPSKVVATAAAKAIAAQNTPPRPAPKTPSKPAPAAPAIKAATASSVISQAAQVVKEQTGAVKDKAIALTGNTPLWLKILGGTLAGILGLAGYKAATKK